MDYRYKKSLGVVEIIIIINAILFLPWILARLFNDATLLYYIRGYCALNININIPGNFPVGLTIKDGAYWQFLTSMFLHGGLMHLLFNMYALFLFGKPLEIKQDPWKLNYVSFANLRIK